MPQTLYTVEPGSEPIAEGPFADSPVLPPFEKIQSRSFSELLANPPSFRHLRQPSENTSYGLMDKARGESPLYPVCIGLAYAALALFVVGCDIGGCNSAFSELSGPTLLQHT